MDNTRLRADLTQREQETQCLTAAHTGLSQDIKNLHSKMAAAADEHRAAKTRWQEERGELLSRCLQVQALVTQAQGSIRKKDKDFERLQGLYEKALTRCSDKGTKDKDRHCINISKPLPKTLSQSVKVSLKDGDISLMQSTITHMEEELSSVRNERDQAIQNQRETHETVQAFEAKLKERSDQWDDERTTLLDQLSRHEQAESHRQHGLAATFSQHDDQMASLRQKLEHAQAALAQQDGVIRQGKL